MHLHVFSFNPFTTLQGSIDTKKLRLSDKFVEGECSFQFEATEKLCKSPGICLLTKAHLYFFLHRKSSLFPRESSSFT